MTRALLLLSIGCALLVGCTMPRTTPTLAPPGATATTAITATATARRVEAQRELYKQLSRLHCTVETPYNEVLNVRQAPGTDQEIIGGLLPGTRVEVITTGAWYEIEYGGRAGYIASEFCRRIGP